MPRDARIERDGQLLDYTCHNAQFETNTERGQTLENHPHGGSVFGAPLVTGQGWSLWLEYVIAYPDGDDNWFWLMWYDDTTRMPTIPMSGVLRRDDLATISAQLAAFIHIP